MLRWKWRQGSTEDLVWTQRTRGERMRATDWRVPAAGCSPVPDALRETLASVLGAQYELLVPIGRGAMGAVFLARERFLDRLVAIKALPAELASSSDARERFLREARTAARLTHPNIVPLYSFGEAGDTLFYVMGYVDGESLESRLRAHSRLPAAQAARLLGEIADALHYAHEQGVVHRDIKPDNILIDRMTGRAMLADFGIAKRGSEDATLTGTGMVLGTPHYMSPEQAAGDRAVDGRSDLYSLGVIGYRMLAGRLPFEGSNVMDVLAQHMTREVPPISEPEVPAMLASVVRRALAKDPATRWQNGHAMRTAVGSGEELDDVDELLPDEVRDSAGMGVRALLITGAIGEAAIASAIFGSGFLARTFAGFAFLTPALLIGLQLPGIAKHLGWRDAIALAFRQPRWWHEWWPRTARRADSIWDQLPRVIRQTRVMGSITGASTLVSFNAVLWMITWDGPGHMAGILSIVALTLLPVVASATAFQRARLWARKFRLSRRDLARLIAAPTIASPFWRRPEIAALLAHPIARPLEAGHAQSPADHLRAIEAIALGGTVVQRDLLADGVEAARELVNAIARCDTELAMLGRDIAPAERARIESRLAEQGSPETEESDAKRRMRALLTDQLALLRGLEDRQAELNGRRERLIGHLHALRLALATLRADNALDAGKAAEITGRIRAIHRDVEIQSEARAEVDALTPGSVGSPVLGLPSRTQSPV